MDIQTKPKRPKSVHSQKDSLIKSSNAIPLPRLLAMVSHELRTPIHAIFGTIKTFKRPGLSDHQLTQLDDIEIAATELITLVNDLLEFSRLESGKAVLSKEVFNLYTFLDSFVHASSSGLQPVKENVALRTTIDVPINMTVEADALRTKQIIRNLLNNALKYTEIGSVHFQAHIKHQDTQTYELEMIIADTGIGIPKSLLEDIFTPFSRVKNAHMDRIEGVGLGLTICHQLVEIMNGQIKVDSVLGEGSAFTVTIPLTLAETLEPVVTEFEIKQDCDVYQPGFKKNYHILVAEDHLINQKIMRVMLEDLGCTVDLTDCGDQAVEMVQTGNYDAVLMDISLNGMGGVEATELIRALPTEKSNIPVIAVTAHALDEEKKAFLQAGLDDVATKPLSENTLTYILKKHLEFDH